LSAYHVAFAPLLPWIGLAVLALCALAALAAQVWLRRRGSFWRGLAFALILLALADPSLTREDHRPLKDVVAVVLDHSGSQTIGERKAQTDAARLELQKRLGALDNVEARFIDYTDSDSDNEGTRLFAALQAGLADVPPDRVGAAIMVTDGIVHDIPHNVEALGFKAPLHALITGHDGERDRRVELVEAPRFGIVGQDLVITARVLDTSDHGEPVAMEVRRDGEPIETLSAVVGETIHVRVHIEHAGPNVVELEVAGLPDELTLLNNKAVVTIQGVRDKLRVLLVSGEPHQGERMWRNLLKSDPNVELVHFTILRPPEKSADGTPINELSLIAFPVADLFGRKINDFNLIIFDRYSNQTILPKIYFDNIVTYVRDGGALMLAEGPDFSTPDGLYSSPLGELSPARPDGEIVEQPFRASVSSEGERHPVTRGLPLNDGAPWGAWFRQIGAETVPGAVNVMSGVDNRPLLVLSRAGKGRVALLLSDQMWLWARGYDQGGPYLDLSRRLAHWLMKEPELEENALTAKVEHGALMVERRSTEAAPAGEAIVTDPEGGKSTLKLTPDRPGRATGSVSATTPGVWQVTDGTQQAFAAAGAANPLELADLRATATVLAPLIRASGGSVHWLDPAGAPALRRTEPGRETAGYSWIGMQRRHDHVVTGIAATPLLPTWLALPLMLGLAILAWRREGM